MARALIVGCGCRGRELGVELASRGWQVRGTSRRQEGLDAIAAAGFEAAEADPDRPGTVLELCGDVAVVIWLLGSASGEPEELAAIHRDRLERLLEKLVDSPVRGFAYEASGTVDSSRLREGAALVERAAEVWRIRVKLLTGDRDDPGWAGSGGEAVAALLAG